MSRKRSRSGDNEESSEFVDEYGNYKFTFQGINNYTDTIYNIRAYAQRINERVSMLTEIRFDTKYKEAIDKDSSNDLSDKDKEKYYDEKRLESIERSKKVTVEIDNIEGYVYRLQQYLKELKEKERNHKLRHCNHEWIIDYDTCWDPCGPAPKICKHCGE
jgi:hypothetical protein